MLSIAPRMGRLGEMAMAHDRLGWAVEVLSPRQSEHILEIGCGHGVAAGLVCDRLVDGRLIAIDRSAAMIEAARRRNADHVASGRAEFRVAELAGLELASACFDKAFAVRVGVFARSDPASELATLRQHLSPAGRLFLFHDEPSRSAAEILLRLESGLGSSGWGVEARLVGAVEGCEVACLIARPPD